MENGTPTGLKQLFQGMIPEAPGVIEGIVTTVNPLQITLMNDSKMILGKNSLVVPEHLTDYKVEVDLELSSGSINSKTSEQSGEHKHEDGLHEGHATGDGGHSHEGGKHGHTLATFSINSGMLHVHNGLKKGEKVFLLAYNNGKKYYILDRKG